ALGGELDGAVDQREERVVAAQADAVARVELRAALADADVAGLDGLAAEDLHTQVLRVGVAAVAGRTACFFVCHGCWSFLAGATGSAGDRGFGAVLAVVRPLDVVLAAGELDEPGLVGAAGAHDPGGDGGAAQRVAALDAVAAAQHQDVGERDLVAGLGFELFDA